MIEEKQAIENWPGIEAPTPTSDQTLQDYLTACGIQHFSAIECLTMRRAGVVVDPPPRAWWPRIIPTLRVAEMLRDILGHGLIVGNGYRPKAENRKAGGARNSQHIHFRALDLDLPKGQHSSGNRKRFYEAAVSLWLTLGDEYQIGCGLYSPRGGSRVHIDTGYKKRRWEKQYVDPIARGLR
jgi:hypothetical protein